MSARDPHAWMREAARAEEVVRARREGRFVFVPRAVVQDEETDYPAPRPEDSDPLLIAAKKAQRKAALASRGRVKAASGCPCGSGRRPQPCRECQKKGAAAPIHGCRYCNPFCGDCDACTACGARRKRGDACPGCGK